MNNQPYSQPHNQPSVLKAGLPILFFVLVLLFGLFVQPVILDAGMLPLEILILIALTFSCVYLLVLGHPWSLIQEKITAKVAESIPVVMILFCIGVLIGSWIVSGTIPMLIYYGISMIDPDWIYIFAFLICIVFSLLTGTSWGSAGTIGIVMIGIAQVYEADLAITAGAIVGGSFFGDKMSPLSDTTNIASLASGVKLMDHIRSMLYTTGPSAVIASGIYIALSPHFSGSEQVIGMPETIEQTMNGIQSIFSFHILLLLPLVIVIWGSIKGKPIVLTLLISAWVALILALIFQSFTLSDVLMSLNRGFNISMSGLDTSEMATLNILNRGGLYNLIEGVVSCILIFAFIGTLEVMNSIKVVIRAMMARITTPSKLILATLTATGLTNLTTSNQYATSFIIGETFRIKYDSLKVHRKVLSRSIEDAGTMLENLAPWTPSGLFMAATLGVTSLQYAPYQFLSLINIVVAYLFAYSGYACFLKEKPPE